jgi:flagellar hook-associated protein 3
MENLARLNEQITTGARVIRPSDNPSDANRVLHLRDQQRELESYSENLDSVELGLNHGYNLMSQISDVLISLRTTLTQAATASYSEENRMILASAVDASLEQAVALANGSILGRYLFAGQSIGSVPYQVTRDNAGQITSVQYVGSQADMPVAVAPGVESSAQFVGDKIFRSNNRQAPEFLGQTGVQGGTGTSNITGDVWLTMTHTLTKHDHASNPNIQAGTSSAAGDTILGAHVLTVDTDGTSGTVRLDGGQIVSFTGGEADLLVTAPGGDKVYLDVTALSGAYTGDLWIKGEGEMSIDHGATWVAFTDADFTDSNFGVTDGATGQILYLDGATVKRIGVEPVRAQGTYDLFSMLVDIRDTLNNTMDVDSDVQLAALLRAGEAVDEVSNGLTQAMTSTGSRLQALDSLDHSLKGLAYSVHDEAATIQNADIVDLATKMARAQTLYEMTLATTGKSLNLSLLDFI